LTAEGRQFVQLRWRLWNVSRRTVEIFYFWATVMMEFCLLESVESELTFLRNKLPPSSGWKSKPIKKPTWRRQQAKLPLITFYNGISFILILTVYKIIILPCVGVNIDGVLDWMFGFIDTLFTQLEPTGNYSATAISTHFTVHRYTRTRVLFLQKSHPGNGFITVSLSLQITHEVFFSPPNSFLAISSQSPWTAISRTRPNYWQLTQMNLLQLLTTTNCSLGTSRYIVSGRTPRKTPSSIVPYCFRRVY
jgi:hypothetical protein